MLLTLIQLNLLLAETVESGQQTEKGSIPIEQLALVAGIVLISFVFLRISLKRVALSKQRSQMTVEERVNSQINSRRNEIATYDQLNELMAMLAELSRQINGQIDARLIKLEALLTRADDTLAKLSAATTNGQPVQQEEISNYSKTIQEISDEFRAQIKNTGRDLSENTTEMPKGEAEKLAEIASQNQDRPTESTTPPAELSPESKKIIELAESGLSKVAISQQLGRPVGEIELILSLSGKK